MIHIYNRKKIKEKRAPARMLRLTALAAALVLVLTAALPAAALDDDEFSGYKADKLEIDVGYFGGPYYEKTTFTVDQMWKMDIVYDDYTFIDNMPSVVIDHVAGVRLSDLMEAAGIDLNSVENFYFWTNDKTSDYYTAFSKTELIDAPRYCYYSLPDNFDRVTGTGNASADDVAQRVSTVIALGDDWNRCIAGGEFGSDYKNLNTNTRFRLIYGQNDTSTRTASRSAKWVHKIVVQLGGAPTVSLSDSSLEGKVGSVLRTEAAVNAADSAISSGAQVTWSSSDDSVASVDKDGNITVRSKGKAVITASYGGASASLVVNGDSDDDSSSQTAQSAGGTAGTSSGQGTAGKGSGTGRPDTTGNHNIVPSQTVTDTDMGGVQNWRVYKMPDDTQALAVTESKSPLLPAMGASAGILLAGGIIGRIVKFRIDAGRFGKLRITQWRTR